MVLDAWFNVWIGWQILMVNTGWLGPETIRTPLVKGIELNSNTMARTELTACRSTVEKNRLMLARPFLKQPALMFKVRRLYLHACNTLNRHARRSSWFHRRQSISIAAPLADQITVWPRVPFVVRVTTLTSVHYGLDLAAWVTAENETKLSSRRSRYE
jgi:hypothetical protein